MVVMIWSTTTQFILIGMAAFCISFGVIYSLIFCYKSRRKSQCSEETERLRDELLHNKILSRRKSTSLTSPPLSDSVINPNYNASPLRVPTRHLRSTSATYSPTHYLSPHHRRNSTPTQPPASTSVSAACSCCGAPRGGITKSKSATSTEQQHSITSTSSLSSSTSPSPSSHTTTPEITTTTNCCKCNANGNEYSSSSPPQENDEWDEHNHLQNNDFLSTHTYKLIPVVNNSKARPPSKLTLNGNKQHDEDNHYYQQNHRIYQKSFSFGPIPAARKARIAAATAAQVTASSPTGNNLEQMNSTDISSPPCITLTTAPPTFTTTQTNINIIMKNKDCEDWEEKQPLLIKKQYPRRGEKVDSSTEKADVDEDDNNDRKTCVNNNSGRKESKKKTTSDLFKKENMVMEEIPYYVEQRSMGCN